jgi:hypothetical protein
MGTSYFFNYYLVPRYLFTKRFGLFALYTFYLLVVSLCLELLASVSAMLLIVFFKVNDTGPLVTDVYFLALIMYFFVFVKSFILMLNRYFSDKQVIHALEIRQQQMEQGYFTITSERKTRRISFDDVQYVESLADYVKIHLKDGKVITSKHKISHLENELPDTFLRIHRSFLVNTNYVDAFTREYVLMGDLELPVGRSFKQNVVKFLDH